MNSYCPSSIPHFGCRKEKLSELEEKDCEILTISSKKLDLRDQNSVNQFTVNNLAS